MDDRGDEIDEIDFDFFPEEGREEVARDRRLGRLRSALPTGPRLPPAVAARRRRFAVGVAVGVILLVVIVLVVTGGSSGPAAGERDYLSKLSPIAADSQAIGRSLEQLLSRLRQASSERPTVLAKLDSLIARSQAELDRARQLKPPQGLRSEQAQARAAFDFRVRGLQGLRQTLSQAFAGKSAAAFATPLAAQIERLLTSDVIWQDLVATPAAALLERDGVSGVAVPQSRFISDPNQSSRTSIAKLLRPATSTTAKATTLHVSDHGPAVVAWQKLLNRWFQLTAPTQKPIAADGSFGQATLAATEALQRAAGITPDGVVGPTTRRALQQALTGQKPAAARTG